MAAATVAAAGLGWWPAFTLGVYGVVFFEQHLALWAAATSAFLAAVLMGGRRMLRRPAAYNAALDLVARMERAGSAFVLRPVRPLVVGRMERDPARLEALYRQGYDETLARLPELRAWLRTG